MNYSMEAPVNYSMEAPAGATILAVLVLLRETADILIVLDTKYTLEVPTVPPRLGISDTPLLHEAHRRKQACNRPLSYQWIAIDTSTGHQCRKVLKPEKAESRPHLGDIVRMAVVDLGYVLEALRRRQQHIPLRVIIVWH